MNKTLLLTCCTAAFWAFNATASETTPYMAARLSYSHIRNDVNQWVNDSNYKSIIADKNLSDNVWGGRLAVGAAFAPAIRAEVEYTLMDKTHNSGMYSHNINGFSLPTNYEIESKIQALMVNAYYDFDTGTKLKPYVSAGLGYSHIKEKASVSNQYAKETAKDSKDSLAWSLGIGASYALSEKTTLELGYRYTDYGDKKDSEHRGRYQSSAKRDYIASEFLFGVRYSF